MDPQVRRLWVEALRSKKYRQTTDHLYVRNHDEFGQVIEAYCALGVLCQKAVEEGVVTNWSEAVGLPGSAEAEYPSQLVLEWSGLSSGEVSAVTVANDCRCSSFNEIANLIEDLDIGGGTNE